MKVNPRSEKEIAEAGLLSPGRYSFEIMDAEDTVSKTSGADMIKLKVKVFGDDGSEAVVWDYLLEAMAAKLRHACDACGLLESYNAGELDSQDFIGKTGFCKVAIQKDKTGNFPDRNGIADYLAPVSDAATPKRTSVGRTPQPAPAADADLNDEIPF